MKTCYCITVFLPLFLPSVADNRNDLFACQFGFIDDGSEDVDDYCRRCHHEMEAPSESAIFNEITIGYSNNFRPRKHASDTVQVNASLFLQTISDFNIQENQLTMKAELDLLWYDDFLKWSSAKCVQSITCPASKIWTPDLSIINAPDGNARGYLNPSIYKISVERNGSVSYYPTGEFSVTCELNLEFYPFDEQVCAVKLQSTNYDDHQLQLDFDFTKSGNPYQLQSWNNSWTDHPLWIVRELRSFKITREESKKTYTILIFELLLSRRPQYYYINMVTPGIIIASIQLVVYAMAIDAVAKFNLAFTCLLSYTVFNNMVMNDIPKSSLQVPVIALYIYLQLAYITVIVIGGQAAVFYINSRGNIKGSKPPGWVMKALNLNPSLAFCFTGKPKEKPKSSQIAPATAAAAAENELVAEDASARKEEEPSAAPKPLPSAAVGIIDGGEDGKKQWTTVAIFINRLTMFFYVTAIVLTPIILFRALPKQMSLKDYNRKY